MTYKGLRNGWRTEDSVMDDGLWGLRVNAWIVVAKCICGGLRTPIMIESLTDIFFVEPLSSHITSSLTDIWRLTGSWHSNFVEIENDHFHINSVPGSWDNKRGKIKNMNWSLANHWILNSQAQFHSIINLTAVMFYAGFVMRSIGLKKGFKAVWNHHQSFRHAVKVVLSR